MLMELVGESLAKQQLLTTTSSRTFKSAGTFNVVLHSITMDYVSPGRSDVTTIEAIPLSTTQMRVAIYAHDSAHDRGRKIISVGILVWSVAATMTSKL